MNMNGPLDPLEKLAEMQQDQTPAKMFQVGHERYGTAGYALLVLPQHGEKARKLLCELIGVEYVP